PMAGFESRAVGLDALEEMVALVEHKDADFAQEHALFAATLRVDDRMADVAALGYPKPIDDCLQALGVVAGDFRLQALGLFLKDCGDRVVNRGGKDADAKCDHDGGGGELPSRHSGRTRNH